MRKFEGFSEGPLKIEREDQADRILLSFEGKSILRDPAELLQPLLMQVLEEATESSRRLVLDFRLLTYMNSSTFTPLVKTLEHARIGNAMITVIYDDTAKWQSVSFTALTIFDTADGRVSVVGNE